MKILTVCAGGQVRSVALANELISIYEANAIPTGAETPHPVNFLWLTDWADKIVLMVPKYMEKIAERNHSKVVMFDIGNDVWGDANNSDLKLIVKNWALNCHLNNLPPGINRR